MIHQIVNLHHGVFGRLERIAGSWFLPLAARLVFLAVLFNYYLWSAFTKVGEGLAGFFSIRAGAYYQILTESVLARYDDDTALVPFHLDLVVWFGTYSEFLLPVLIVLGLFTRLAALGMIAFIAVQSWVDINLHGVEAATAGAWFDRFSGGLIADQRSLWVFLLIVLVVRGGGAISLDRLLAARFASRKAG